MRSVSLRIIGICAAVGAGCAHQPMQPPLLQDGTLHYQTSWTSGPIQCDGRPIVLEGTHTALRLSGPCQFVRVAGDHNDISVEIAPTGTIEITGSHNDVTWHTVRGARPALENRGVSNTFHHGEDL